MKYKFYSFFVILIVLSSCNKKQEQYKQVNNEVGKYVDGYVGDDKCRACHEEAFDLWKGSHHDLAMQVANDSTVLGDFNDISTTIDGVSYFFSKKEGDFYVDIKEIDGSENQYKIDYTFGVTPLQQYMVDFDRGRKQVLRVTWDVLENKWYHQYPGDKIAAHDWLHWTRGAQNWNTMCAECHSTNLKKNYFVEKDSFHTTYSSINVSCESCHGPAEKHMNWASVENPSGNHYMVEGKTQMEQLNLCAPCHARRAKLTKDLEPGKAFDDQYLLQPITSNFYHGDGQIDEEDYVFGSFVQSKMYHNKIKCNDCHNVHSLKLKEVGNKLCMQCHVPKYNTPEHHFHETGTEGAACINCHMTGKNYMGNDFRRDHSFRIPRPDQSVAYNTPNACNACHTDKSKEWAANAVIQWYGPKRLDHFSDALLKSNSDNLSLNERKDLDKFMTDLKFPAIARATVIDNLFFTSNEDMLVLLETLKDPSPIVRYNALLKFRSLALQDRTPIALKHVNDTTKLVRIGAAQLVIGLDKSSLNESDRTGLSNAQSELEAMLYSNADFSTGRMQLGDYYLQNNDIKTAIKHYEMAIKMDSLLTPVYSNLATAYSIDGQVEKALYTLNTWIVVQPEASRPYYLRALLNFELKENEKAIADLKMAIKLNPNDSRSMYNLATIYYQQRDFQKATLLINKALKIEPNNNDFQYLLALCYKGQGRVNEMQKIMTKLNKETPN
jgi:tetratricopeptide (TPR) repeat protein